MKLSILRRRVLSAEADNIEAINIRRIMEISEGTKAEFNNCFIIHSK